VTFTLTHVCTGGGNTFGTFLSAYGGAFDPLNLATNHLADTGSSPASGAAGTTMQVQMTAGQSITLVVNQVNDTTTAPVSTCTYTVMDDAAPTVPATSPTGLLAMALALGALGFVYLRRRAARA
jgi:hypothetical protein